VYRSRLRYNSFHDIKVRNPLRWKDRCIDAGADAGSQRIGVGAAQLSEFTPGRIYFGIFLKQVELKEENKIETSSKESDKVKKVRLSQTFQSVCTCTGQHPSSKFHRPLSISISSSKFDEEMAALCYETPLRTERFFKLTCGLHYPFTCCNAFVKTAKLSSYSWTNYSSVARHMTAYIHSTLLFRTSTKFKITVTTAIW
jgi:hypothetical protein